MSDTKKAKGGFKPSAQVDGGMYEFDGYIRGAKTGTFTYPSGPVGVGLFLDIQSDDPDSDERKEDFYSCGSSAQITPTDDGKGFLDKNGEPIEGLNKNSNGGRFFREVVAGGFDEANMHVNGEYNDVSFLIGQRFHFALVENKTVGGKADSKKLFPTKYLGVAGGVSKTAAKPANDTVTPAVISVLTAAGAPVRKADLLQKVGATFGTDVNGKAAAIRTLMSEDFLRSIPGTKFDGQALALSA